MKYLLLGFLLCGVCSCSLDKKDTSYELSQETLERMECSWNVLVNMDCCLYGTQYKRYPFGWLITPEDHLMYERKEWRSFLRASKKDLTLFLISKFENTEETLTHTCSFFLATQGELAVYALQVVHNKNWFDFEEFSEYKDRKTTSSEDNAQQWLQQILCQPESCRQMKDLWLSRI